MKCHRLRASSAGRRDQGFSLIELMVAVAIFLVVSASVLMLFSRQQTNANQQQGLTGLNIALRNSTAQLQLDLANAGTDSATSGVHWPVGVTIINNVTASGTSCYNSTTGLYSSGCFDQLNIIEASTSVPPLPATSSAGVQSTSNCSDTSTGVAYGYSTTPSATAGYFSSGDKLLFLNSTGTKITEVLLTAAPAQAGSANAVRFTFNATNGDGSTKNLTNDPLDIAACGGGVSSCSSSSYFTNSFCGNDYIVKLAPVIYSVDTTTTPSNPQLIRQDQLGNKTVVMDQILGFKVGAAIYNSNTSIESWGSSYFFYDASKYNIDSSTTPDSPYLFGLVRAVRMSIIARTKPSADPSFTFRNAFDQGAYYVQGTSVVVAPRNVSIND